ncbi:Uncharacterized protein HZ326_11837 [Fusarium oxysporum f. sp. albedinis]|nr:hypothetical protein HZ326_20434 [Fusarium oxysporum f. sp. albedinis]KAJ0145407.1 Uncharacterized protein HZ326_11837 [Fusarium oxysporum f. sp. albedinis]
MASDFKAEARLLPDLTLCLTSVEWQIARFAPQPSTPVNRQLSTVYSAQKCTYVVSVPKGGGRDNNANGGVGNVPPQTGNADYRLTAEAWEGRHLVGQPYIRQMGYMQVPATASSCRAAMGFGGTIDFRLCSHRFIPLKASPRGLERKPGYVNSLGGLTSNTTHFYIDGQRPQQQTSRISQEHNKPAQTTY